MKRKIRLILAVIICVLLTGCAGGQMKADSNLAHFSSLTWKSTEEDMQNELGKYLEKNRLEDGGNSYRYNGTYGGEKGTVTYVFNKDGELTVMTFYCSVKNKADLTKIYYRKLIIFLEVLKCRQSLMFQGFPAFLVTEDVLKSP